METLDAGARDYVYDLDVRDYNLWTREKLPVVFVLFSAVPSRAYSLRIQRYFRADGTRQPEQARSVRIRVPKRQAVSGRAVAKWRALQWPAIRQERGEGL